MGSYQILNRGLILVRLLRSHVLSTENETGMEYHLDGQLSNTKKMESLNLKIAIILMKYCRYGVKRKKNQSTNQLNLKE